MAALLGAIFHKNLVDKALRGMAVASGRIADARSYGGGSKERSRSGGGDRANVADLALFVFKRPRRPVGRRL